MVRGHKSSRRSFGFAVEALPGPHFGGERSVDPREGRVGTKFRGNARMHDL